MHMRPIVNWLDIGLIDRQIEFSGFDEDCFVTFRILILIAPYLKMLVTVNSLSC